MNFGAISPHTLAGKILRAPLRLVPPNAKLPILQGRCRGKKWIAGSFVPACWLGTYEYYTRLNLERLVKPSSIIFDIGAHVGYFTLLSSVLVGPKGRVFAFEPLPRNLAYLKEHVRLNHVQNVEVIEAAVADRPGMVIFDQGPAEARGSFARIADLGRWRGSPADAVEVKAISLDEEIAQGGLPLPHYVKIDVERGEKLVLFGARAMLSQATPTLFVSTHGPELHADCIEFLESLGYEVTPIPGRRLRNEHDLLARPREDRRLSV